MRAARTLPVLAAAVLLPASLPAQSAAVGSTHWYAGVEALSLSFQSGLGGLKSVREIAVPFAAVWQASSRLVFDLGGRYATVSRKDSTGSSVTLSGPTDLQARGAYQIVPDRIAFTVTVNLPTGKAQLTPEQLPVANAIASDLIPFPVANFASGFSVTSGLALAVPVGGWALGLAGSYRANGSFTPIADTGAAGASYKAGGEFRVRLGVDRIAGQGRVSLGVTYSSYGDDTFGSSPLFQSGKRLIPQASWSFPVGNVGLALYAWDVYRGAGSVIVSGTSSEKRNVLAVGALASIPTGRSVLRPQVEFRDYSIGLCQGTVTSSFCAGGKLGSFSLRYDLGLGGRVALAPLARLHVGNVVNPSTGQAVSFTGWDVGLTLRATM
jgi:hypothetical protein